MAKILIVCGEASGDLNAANLIQALRKNNPYLEISGVGGEFMKNAGAEVFYDIKGLSVIGLFDVLKKLPEFFGLKKIVMDEIKKRSPDCVILVDFSGFNLRLAKEINNTVPVYYYISPQVWASRQGRIKTIKKYIRKMIVLFKFEESFYRKFGIEAHFVGHPLLDIVSPQMNSRDFMDKYQLSERKTIISLLPGSRKQEVKNILPLMIKTAILINKKADSIEFLIAKSPNVEWEIYNRITARSGLDLKIVEGKTYDCLNVSGFCLVASGTATLETAIMQKPFFVIYKMNLLNYLLYRPQVKVPFIGMVNIVAGRRIVPEFIQFNAKPGLIASEAMDLLKDQNKVRTMENDLKQIKTLLGERGAAGRAAIIILESLKNESKPN